MFAVTYKFFVKEGSEGTFIKSWKIMTNEFIHSHQGFRVNA